MTSIFKCPHCGKYNTIVKAGHQLKSGIGQIQQYRCKNCGKSTTKPIEQHRDDKGHFISTSVTDSLETN